MDPTATSAIMGPTLWLVGLISEWLTAIGDTIIVLTPFALLALALEGYYGRGFRWRWLASIIAALFLMRTSGLAIDTMIAYHVPSGSGFRHVVYDPDDAAGLVDRDGNVVWRGF